MEEYKDIAERLEREWEAQGRNDETPEEQLSSFLDLILRKERVRHRVKDGTPEADAVDKRTLANILNPDGLSGEFALLEAFLRRWKANANTRNAYDYLSDEIHRKSAVQSKRASNERPSRHDSITRMINEIVEDNPKVSAKQVGQYLLSTGEIEYDRDQYIHKTDRDAVIERALTVRVSNAKKRLRKKDSR